MRFVRVPRHFRGWVLAFTAALLASGLPQAARAENPTQSGAPTAQGPASTAPTGDLPAPDTLPENGPLPPGPGFVTGPPSSAPPAPGTSPSDPASSPSPDATPPTPDTTSPTTSPPPDATTPPTPDTTSAPDTTLPTSPDPTPPAAEPAPLVSPVPALPVPGPAPASPAAAVIRTPTIEFLPHRPHRPHRRASGAGATLRVPQRLRAAPMVARVRHASAASASVRRAALGGIARSVPPARCSFPPC